ncbi:MAG: HaeIII family restriction endonuclease [Balneola sp.]
MSSQVKNGKAFEFALINELYERLSLMTEVSVLKDSSYENVKHCFHSFSEKKKDSYIITASAAINYLIDLEPRLSDNLNSDDILTLEIVPDSKGQKGDVRDVIMIRSLQKWEIGISAKNNHHALKHSRLSTRLDFGKEWVNLPSSDKYFDEIGIIFNKLTNIRKKNKKAIWEDHFNDKFQELYKPILSAFKKEILSLQERDPKNFAHNLTQYLIGRKDFYKIIKSRDKVEIHAFNINGTLNQSSKRRKPKGKITKIKFPSRLIEVVFKEGHENTLIAYFDRGWQLSFRIHTASSKVEASMKFDIRLISAPYNLFSNHILIKN